MNMINAKELRIGNLFFDEDKTPCYYAGSWQRNDGWIHRDSANNTYKEAGMYPIELTEDIIIKCGFQKLSFNDGRHLFKLNEFYIEQRGLKFNRVEVNDAGNRIMYVGGKTTCDYVHQLQNLYYALTGEELNIELNAPVSDTTQA